MKGKHSKLAIVLILFSFAVLTACGGEWDAISKKGNAWEYQVEKDGAKVNVVSKVTENYEVGDNKYAAVAFNETTYKDVTTIFTWDKEQEALMIAGRSSRFGDGKPQFFVQDTIFGKIKGGKGTVFTNIDGSVVTFNGEEKVKVTAGDFTAYKFTRVNTAKNINETYWYVSKKGFVKIIRGQGVMSLVKFTEGKGGDPKKLGNEDSAEKGCALIKTFYTTAVKSGIKEVMALFSKSGKQNAEASMPDLKMLIERIKKHNKAKQATVYFEGKNAFGLRFRYYTEEKGEPDLYRVDTIFELEKADGKYKIKTFRITYSKIVA